MNIIKISICSILFSSFAFAGLVHTPAPNCHETFLLMVEHIQRGVSSAKKSRKAQFSYMEAMMLPELQTSILYHSAGRLMKGTKFRALLSPGFTAQRSNAKGLSPLIKNLSPMQTINHFDRRPEQLALSFKTIRGKLLERALKDPSFHLPTISSEAINFIGHGGPGLEDFPNLRAIDAWYDQYVQTIRRETPEDIPLIGIAKSGSPAFVTRNTTLDAYILINPTMPPHKEMLPGEFETEISDIITRNSVTYPHIDFMQPAIDWFVKNLSEISWDTNGYNFNGKPTLILIGENDFEVSDYAKQYYLKMAEKFNNIETVVIKDGVHEIIDDNRKAKLPSNDGGERLVNDINIHTYFAIFEFLSSL